MADESVKDKAGAAVAKAKRRVGLEQPAAAEDDGRIGVVRGALRAFGEGDVDGFLDTLREDVLWEGPQGKTFPGAGELSGRDEVRSKFAEPIARTYSSFGFRPESFLDADSEDSVLVIGRFQAEAVEGDSVDVAAVQLWEFKGSEAQRIVIFADSAPFPELLTEDKSKELQQQAEEEEKEREKDEHEGGDGEASAEGDKPAEKSSDQDEPGEGGEPADEPSGQDEPSAQDDDGGGQTPQGSSENGAGSKEESRDEGEKSAQQSG